MKINASQSCKVSKILNPLRLRWIWSFRYEIYMIKCALSILLDSLKKFLIWYIMEGLNLMMPVIENVPLACKN